RLLLSLEATDGRCLSRARSPWSSSPWPPGRRPALGSLAAVRARLRPARARAHLLLDTTHLDPAGVGRRLRRLLPLALDPPTTSVLVLESFSFLLGPPLDAEWVIDARFLRNPFWEPELRDLTGRDAAVRRFVLDQPAATVALAALAEMVHAVEPAYRERGRRVLRVAVGCTGGQHRSVALVEAAAQAWRRRGRMVVSWHRDCPRRP
ncbi:MAG TPA: RNase adapter RapZ, partial [Candidatus Dormibacteraeota bacterium]|nr:RNase adapter RapZ [Candidatus Dormibacteraeota bacterium]